MCYKVKGMLRGIDESGIITEKIFIITFEGKELGKQR
jgi:hypothetical protein